jgi:hypothetical protein
VQGNSDGDDSVDESDDDIPYLQFLLSSTKIASHQKGKGVILVGKIVGDFHINFVIIIGWIDFIFVRAI